MNVLQINTMLLLEMSKESARHAQPITKLLSTKLIVLCQVATETSKSLRMVNAESVPTIRRSHKTRRDVRTLDVIQEQRSFHHKAYASDAILIGSAQEIEDLVSKPHADLMNTDPKRVSALDIEDCDCLSQMK